MVSALDPGWSGPGSIHQRGTELCSWARHLYSHIATFYPEINQINAEGKPYYGLASHLGRSGNSSSRFMLQTQEEAPA